MIISLSPLFNFLGKISFIFQKNYYFKLEKGYVHFLLFLSTFLPVVLWKVLTNKRIPWYLRFIALKAEIINGRYCRYVINCDKDISQKISNLLYLNFEKYFSAPILHVSVLDWIRNLFILLNVKFSEKLTILEEAELAKLKKMLQDWIRSI